MWGNVLVYGVINSATFILLTLGFSIVFGISRIANFAYGAFYLSAGYLTWVFLTKANLPLFLALPLTILIMGVLGFMGYWVMIYRIRGNTLSEVIATFALGVGILEFFRWMGFVTYEFSLPFLKKGTIEIVGIPLDYQRLLIVLIAGGLLAFLYFYTHHTRIGRAFRAIAQNERTAISLGINSDFIGALSFSLGTAVTAIAAVTVLPLGIITINIGYEVLLTAMAVGIIGGLESIIGIVIASFILGFAQVLAAIYIAPHWSIVVILASILGVLLVRPSGIFGKYKELEERV
uniref:Branched-chain amino acid ABC transporter permease n=1 Tax=candidate division WOR-3 bacterium TaxID=2052148 RepID=A0A7C2K5W3_UNCW3